jgi:hypothetical protein
MYSRLFKGKISDAVCGHFHNFNDLLNAIQKKNFIQATSTRFLCRPTGFFRLAVAVGRQRALHTENSGFASPTLGRHISTFRGYRILFSIRNPYINCFTNHFSIHS